MHRRPSINTNWRRALQGLLLSGLAGALTACEQPPLTPNGVIAVFGGVGLGPGAFSYPRAVTAEPAGSLFVVDKSGRIQRFSPQGEFETGWTMPQTKQGKPVGLSVAPDGRIFVADTHYHRVIVFDRDGIQLDAFATKESGSKETQLPTDVDVDDDGFIYVSEYQGDDRITKWSPDGQFVAALGEGPIEGVPLRRPAAIDFDRQQTLWVADACNHRIVRLSREGEILAVFGGFGDEPGHFRYPYDITVTPQDTIMVCEYGGNRLQWLSKDGRSLRVWGDAGRATGQLFAPWGATYGQNGDVYVVDSLNSRIQVIRP